MSGPNIGNYGGFGTQDPNASSIPGAGNVSGTNPISKSSNSSDESTIERSQLEAIMMLLSAGIPFLTPPQSIATSFQDLSAAKGISGVTAVSNIDISQIKMQVDQTKNDIINSMWDSFLKNVREMAERAKQDNIKKWTEDVNKNGPKSSTEYYAYLMALSSSQRSEEISGNGNVLASQFNQTFNQWLVSPALQAENIAGGGYPSASFIAGSVAANSDAVRDAIGAAGAVVGYQMSVSPVADALYAVGPNSALPADSQAAAALVTALLNGGAAFKATNDSIQQAANGGTPPRDLDFAMNYAKNIMNIVTHNVGNGEPLSKEQTSQNQMIRLMLTTMALVLVYRTAYGGITGPEFGSLLNPESSKDLPEEIRPLTQQLASLLKSYLPDDPSGRVNTLNRLTAYADQNESVDSMLSTSRMFSGLLTTGDINHKRLESETG
jgi:hypothetical protein